MTDHYAESDTWPNPPASQQPARPATLAASGPSRVLGEGSDAAEAREAAYAEAIRCAVAPLSEETTAEDWLEEARAVMAVADAERAELRAEIERLKRGGAELGRILDRTLRDALDASGRHDVIEEDGDGDWALVWETLAELRPRAEAAEAEVERLRDLAQRNFKQGAALLGELQSAERARDAALAEVTGLRDRLEALLAYLSPGLGIERTVSVTGAASLVHVVRDAKRLRAALAVPVMGGTEDASPAAEDEPRPRRYDQCDETCTTDCGHCKGAASPTEGSEIPTPEASGAGSIEQATEGGA